MLMFMLFHSTATKAAYIPNKADHKASERSYISQAQANRNAARVLFFIYSHTPREAVSIDNQTYDIKSSIRLLTYLDVNKNILQPTHLPDEYMYSFLHPDPVGYYIFTLKKIII